MRILAVVLLLITATAQASDGPFKYADEHGSLTVLASDVPKLIWRYDPFVYEPGVRKLYASKPYVSNLYSPNGTNVLRDSPQDQKNHHGLMFGLVVDRSNFWDEQTEHGEQQEREHKFDILGDFHAIGEATLTQTVNWSDSAHSLILDEDRTIVLHRPADMVPTLLTWISALHGLDGKPTPAFSGKQDNGLGMRFVESMDKGGTFFNADGGMGVKGTVGSKSKWCAYSASADGKVVTVAMFDNPKNERYPATWYTMDTPFAYLSATLGLDKAPLQKLDLFLTYGVAVWDGQTPKEKVEEVYQRWLKLVEPVVEHAN